MSFIVDGTKKKAAFSWLLLFILFMQHFSGFCYNHRTAPNTHSGHINMESFHNIYTHPEDTASHTQHKHDCTSLDKARHRYRLEDEHRHRYVSLTASLPEGQARDRRHINETPHRERSIYFSGKEETLMLKTPEPYSSLTGNFTVELWVKPQGGQLTPVSIIGMYDICVSSERLRGWTLGITTPSNEEYAEARFFFHLHGDRSREGTVVMAPSTYTPLSWKHVAATYDGQAVTMYIDGTRVAIGHGQRGMLFSPPSASCKKILLGADVRRGHFYRGSVDQLRVWSVARSHQDIVDDMRWSISDDVPPAVVTQDDFNTLSQWEVRFDNSPELQTSKIPDIATGLHVKPPACGVTVCDNPEIVKSYTKNLSLRGEKFVRYRVINVAEDDGTNPTVTQQQIEMQDRALKDVFRPYNITWKLEEVKVLNSSLRRKSILIGCNPHDVGDHRCNPECQHDATGNDGGDCDTEYIRCSDEQIGNGVCDDNCNRVDYNFDGGDCCLPEVVSTHHKCFDSRSPHRAFLSIEEYKSYIDIPSDRQLNIYFAYWVSKDVIGLATFPWEKEVYSTLGGTVVRPDTFGRPDKSVNLVHELGHNLGLWHVHYGVSEVDCNDPCQETQASMTLGDLCEDTNPTIKNFQCRDPSLIGETVCEKKLFYDTPYRNFMGYAGDQCADNFTPQQVARMHCYLDLAYQQWQLNVLPSPIPLAPRVVKAQNNTIKLVWMPPMGSGATAFDLVCRECQGGRPLIQYAHTATSSVPSSTKAYSPSQATGGPDVDSHCSESPLAWVPDLDAKCNIQHCTLELSFKYPAVAESLWIWTTWNRHTGLADVELVFKDETSLSLGFLPTQCDLPLTIPINVNKLLTKVRIHVDTPNIAIDAVKMTSAVDHPKCRSCPRMKYRLSRDPPFHHHGNTNNALILDSEEYIDEDVREGQSYKYQVEALLGNKESAPSPALLYQHGTSFCGNGHVDLNEECDDGNTMNNDGCDNNCKQEKLFRCRGSPSLCYFADGDGICEPEEKSAQDCGWLTPLGFVDQWASSVVAAPGLATSDCPVEVILGAPQIGKVKKCNVEKKDTAVSWYPCNFNFGNEFIWLEIYITKPVVVTNIVLYLATDDLLNPAYKQEAMTVQLIDMNNDLHATGSGDIIINCAQHPHIIDIAQKLSDPFFLTKGVKLTWSSVNVGVSGLAVRSRPDLDPVTMKACSEEQLYSPLIGQCVPYSCERAQCAPHAVKYGDVTCTGVEEGDTCTITCHNGYELASHENRLQCVSGEWVSSGYDVTCIPRDCGPPIVAQALVDCPDGTTFGRKCKFECQSPAKKQGSDTTLTCEVDGMWSLPQAFCLATCAAPPVVKDAILMSRSCEQGDVAVGTRCKLRCRRGYHVASRSQRRRQLQYSCGPEGSWEGPVCARIHCPAPSAIYTGLYSCTDDLYYGSRCTLKCPGPTRLTSTIECMDDGKWDGQFSACKFEPGQCPHPPTGSTVNFRCQGQDIGNECEVSCINPIEEPMMRATDGSRQHLLRSILLDGSSSSLHLVQRITCSGSLAWHPDPQAVTCEPQCLQQFIGDGFCDAANNRAHCQWDGGDCCESTVVGGAVRPYPATCSNACQCKDPDAAEQLHLTASANRVLERRRRLRARDRLRRILIKSHAINYQ